MKYILLILIVTNLYSIDNNNIFEKLMINYKESLSFDYNTIKTTDINKTIILKKTITKTDKEKIFIIQNSYQNLRIYHDNNSQILHVLSKNMKVKIIKKLYIKNNLWLKVKYINSKNKQVIGYLYQGNKK